MDDGFLLSCIAGCTLVSSICTGMIYYQVRDINQRKGVHLEQKIIVLDKKMKDVKAKVKEEEPKW